MSTANKKSKMGYCTVEVEKDIPFVPEHIFECGQCFRFERDADGVYRGVSGNKICKVRGRQIYCKTEDKEYWKRFFAIDTDYNKICKELLSRDEKIKKCIDFGYGIRILRQDVWETTVSFIISANNNIPRIKKIVEKLCEMFGEATEFEGKLYYAFPTPEKLASIPVEELSVLKAGYRDKYIIDAAQKIASGEVNLEEIEKLDDEKAKKALMKIKGVGGKVADCIMLFALGRFSVFPTDVWIKRILSDVYNVSGNESEAFVKDKYGELSGFAQQYLYYYYRLNTTKEK